MAEVLFYHLTESTLEDTLPGLLERSLDRGWKAIVQLGSDERLGALDTHLWTYREDSFLAHGAGSDPFAADQPVVLTTGEDNPNGSEIRFLVDGARPPDLSSYQRAVFLFDGHDDTQVTGARTQWTAMKAAGHTVTYWQQGADRRWERKA